MNERKNLIVKEPVYISNNPIYRCGVDAGISFEGFSVPMKNPATGVSSTAKGSSLKSDDLL